ncbi:fatty-acid amide hydrolase 2-B [Anabrus simplex]|uniref:fatty-acid amide hydrolase 2-B n=1 Tax=Anabrus simplex TaxID=316456 RepID=UPI0035A3ACBB
MEVGLRLVGLLQLIIRWLMKPFYFLSSLKVTRLLPTLKSPYLTKSATELAAKIRTGEVSSEDVVRAFISRIKEVNPLLNAVVEDRFSAALEDAREVDKLVASKRKTEQELEEETPFLGVPFTVKESCKLQGMSYCVGHLPRANIKADKDGEAVHQLRKAGAIPLAVTTTPECCLSWETNNLVTGKTLNAFDRTRTSGGSSGGEGALLGSGASVIGVGSDIAGSIRLPAMYNGVFGHKPTPGYVPVIGHYPYSQDPEFCRYLVLGPMARYAMDLKPMLKIMAGNKAELLKLDEKVDLHKIKAFYMEDFGFSLAALQVDIEVKDRLRQAAKYLQEQFSIPVQKGNFEYLEESVDISCSVFFGMQGLPDMMREIFSSKVESNLIGEICKSLMGTSQYSMSALLFFILVSMNGMVPRSKYPQYYKQMTSLLKSFEETLGDNGVFLYPTHPTPALYHNESYMATAGVLYTTIFNLLGMPSTQVPLGLNSHGMPIGIQVVAAPHHDRLCLAVAEELEKGFGGWFPPPMTSS